MQRAGRRCEANLYGCGRIVASIHHIVKQADGGRNDMDNLIAVCSHCHSWIHKHETDAHARGLLRVPGGRLQAAIRTRQERRANLTFSAGSVFNTCQAEHPVWESVNCLEHPGHDGPHRGVLHSKAKGALNTSWPLQQWERAS